MTSQTPEEELNKCPGCGGKADNGHDRSLPPNPYYCTKCNSVPEGGLRSVKKYRDEILSEMNARRIDGKTYIDSNWLLSEYDKATLSVLVGEIEKEKKPLVHDVNWAEGYNAGLEKTIATITRTLRVE